MARSTIPKQMLTAFKKIKEDEDIRYFNPLSVDYVGPDARDRLFVISQPSPSFLNDTRVDDEDDEHIGDPPCFL